MPRKRGRTSSRRTFLKRAVGATLAAGGTTAFAGSAVADTELTEWPTFRANDANTGVVSPDREPGKNLQVAGQFSTGGAVTSSPAAVDGTVYVGSEDAHVYSLDASDGSVNWAFETSRGVTHTSPAVADGTVYAACPGSIYAIDAADGSQHWQVGVRNVMGPYAIHSSPTVANGLVYMGGGDAVFRALDAETGASEWTYSVDSYIFSTAAVVDGVVYFGDGGNGELFALDAATGEERWRFTPGGTVDLSGQLDSSPAVANGRVFFGRDDHSVYAVDVADGTLDWQFETGGEVNSSPAVGDGTVYVGSNDGNLYALDATDGSREWTVATDGEVISSPVVTEEFVYVGSGDGRVYSIDRETGDVLDTYATGGRIESSPAIAYGGLGVGSNDGTVYALK